MSEGGLDAFSASLPFALDEFQRQGCAALDSGHSVLVSAPTGAGKTVVGEFATFLALQSDLRAFYTTPIKALSNQKYHDLVALYGSDHVGLLTGDVSINGDASVVVMTTEVLRNMLYSDSRAVERLGFVVFDEVHYLADRFRGAVWEETLIHLPRSVQVACLSATVSNAHEFRDWLQQVRGDTALVVSQRRPVPLWQHLMVEGNLLDLYADPADHSKLNDSVVRAINSAQHRSRLQGEWRGGGGTRRQSGPGRQARNADSGRRGRRGPRPRRADIVHTLQAAHLLPAIYFIFSRAGCDAAVAQLRARDTRLTSPDEQHAIEATLDERIGALDAEDLTVLGYRDFRDALSRGFASHHAGLLPVFRQIVEELFTQSLLKVVFATETLALGINMPARSVVLETLVKFNGETHAEISAGEYTQLTGRAGRRGIDDDGHAIVIWSPEVEPREVARLASTQSYPLNSSFRPTYNMTVNLVAQLGIASAREVLETSFAQFQADRSVVEKASTVQRNEATMSALEHELTCQHGDFVEYAQLRSAVSHREKERAKQRSAAARASVELSINDLAEGDVIRVSSRRRQVLAVVVGPASGDPIRLPVITEDKQSRRLPLTSFQHPPAPVAQLSLPPPAQRRSIAARRDIAAQLQRLEVAEQAPGERAESTDHGEIEALRSALRDHPCHSCPDREEHTAAAQPWMTLYKDTRRLRTQISGTTTSIVRTFDAILGILIELGYVTSDGTVTAPGTILRSLYGEKDLVAAECLRRDIWRDLRPPELAAVVSALVHDARRDVDDDDPGNFPNQEVVVAMAATQDVWRALAQTEHAARVPATSPPNPAIVWALYQWCEGEALDYVLYGSGMAAGDFVRRCRQVNDLLHQIARATDDPSMAKHARRASDQLMRGIVAAGISD